MAAAVALSSSLCMLHVQVAECSMLASAFVNAACCMLAIVAASASAGAGSKTF